MTDLAVLNPEIEGLLREIASDPTSTLLRLPPSDLRRARQLGHLPDRAGTTGLNLAERELLRRWREEVAYLLLVACYKGLSSGALHSHRLATFGAMPHRTTKRFHQRAIAASDLVRGSGCPDLVDAADLLRGCIASRAKGSMEIFDIAAAAARLVSSDLATCYAALHLILNSNPSVGVRMMAVAKPTSATARRMVAVNTVYGHERIGSLRSALEATGTGDWPSGTELVRAIAGCLLAAQVSDNSCLLQWVNKINELRPTKAATTEIVEKILQRRRKGDWKPAVGADSRLRAALSRFGPEMVEIANAFA